MSHQVNRRGVAILGVVLGTVLVAGAQAQPGPKAAGATGTSELMRAHEGEGAEATGKITVTARRRRSRLVVVARGLERKTRYRVYADDPGSADPTPVAIAEAISRRSGKLRLRFGTARSPLPFGASLDELASGRFEVRRADASVVLTGTVPKIERAPLDETVAADGCVDRDGVPDCPPTADAGAPITVECAGGRTAVLLDGTASSDPEGADLVYAWTGDFAEGTALGASPTVHFTGVGLYRVSLVVSDGFFRSDPAVVVVEIGDTLPPRISAPDDVQAECDDHRGTRVRLGTPVVSDGCDPAPRVTNDAPERFPLGRTLVTWTALDASGNAATDTQVVTIVDTTPPRLAVSGVPDELWPPNHKMVRITPDILLEDVCDPRPELTLRVSSSEADNATGDGNTTGDYAIRSPRDFDLRAERSGNGSGRVYTLVWTARDRSGNETTARRTVTVPHDRGNGNGNGNGKSKDKNKNK